MIYHFLHFSLNTKTSELTDGEEVILLNSKPFALLLALLEKPNQILDKDYLIDVAWDGRIVSDNTIAQTVGQLRQILNDDVKQPLVIKTHRGRGLSFIPEVQISHPEEKTIIQKHVSIQKNTQQLLRPWLTYLPLIILFLLLISWLFYSFILNTDKKITTYKPDLMILPLSTHSAQPATEKWLADSATDLLKDVVDLGDIAQLRSVEENLTNSYEAVIDKQWALSPDLNFVQTMISQTDSGYQLELRYTDNQQKQTTEFFQGKQLNQILLEAGQWINQQLDSQGDVAKGIEFLPDSEHQMELYMRGLAANDASEFDKAEGYFSLALENNPGFHLARLQLADIKKYQGLMEDALNLLEVLEAQPLNPLLQLQTITIRGDIYNTQGRNEEAKELLETALQQYSGLSDYRLNPLRFELSYIYTDLNQPQLALEILNDIESRIDVESDPYMYANAMHKKGSLLQSMADHPQAFNYANKALNTFIKIDKPLGQAKTHGLLARIYMVEANYKQATHHLFEALNINRKADYKLGVGAGINEIAYLLIRNGQMDKADPLILEMQDIAVQIGHTRMLIAAKQHAVASAMARGDWQSADRLLKQHEKISVESNNPASLKTSYLLRLQYYNDKKEVGDSDKYLELIENLVENSENPKIRIAINLRKAKTLQIKGNHQEAMQLLISNKSSAIEMSDTESVIEINNLLAEHHLAKEPAKALEILEESEAYEPLPYPYLLLRSKSHQALKNQVKALEDAIQAKQGANQLWRRADEMYLNALKTSG